MANGLHNVALASFSASHPQLVQRINGRRMGWPRIENTSDDIEHGYCQEELTHVGDGEGIQQAKTSWEQNVLNRLVIDI